MDYTSPEAVEFNNEFSKAIKKEDQILQEASTKITIIIALSISAGIVLFVLFSLGLFFALR